MDEKETYDDYHVETLEYQSSFMKEIKVAPEIIEIEEEKDDDYKGESNKNDEAPSKCNEEVYVAIGKDDIQVLKWVVTHAIMPGGRVNLIHIFPPISSVSTPVGRLWVGQLSPEQAKIYAIEEQNRRRNLLQKYIRLCVEHKVNVDTVLIESNETTKAILDLIPVLNITSLVMGTKYPPFSRRLIKGPSKGTVIKKHAPEYCKVALVYTGKKPMDDQSVINNVSSSSSSSSSSSFLNSSNDKQSKVTRQKYGGNYKQCTCFPVRF